MFEPISSFIIGLVAGASLALASTAFGVYTAAQWHGIKRRRQWKRITDDTMAKVAEASDAKSGRLGEVVSERRGPSGLHYRVVNDRNLPC